MPTYLIKPTREDDFYMAYSTIVDAAVSWGTRHQFENATVPYYEGRRSDDVPERLARADVHGSSVLGFDAYGFDSGPLIVRWGSAGEREIGPHLIDRVNIRRWLEDVDDGYLRPVTYEDD